MKVSAGILIYKYEKDKLKIFLVHPGGPFWKNKDKGAWSIPKGEVENKNSENIEEYLEDAKRELKEETGISPPEDKSKYIFLGETKLKSGKKIYCWAYEGDWSGLLICSSYVKIEWPPKSGKFQKFPEVDKARFFSIEEGKEKIHDSQKVFLEKLEKVLKNNKK